MGTTRSPHPRYRRAAPARPAYRWTAAAVPLVLAVLVAGCGSTEPVAPPAPTTVSPTTSTPSTGAAPPAGTPPTSAGAPNGAAPATGAPAAGGNQIRVSISAFSWLDNEPPNSAQISDPVLHRAAGGQGTFADPITVSVPDTPAPAAFPPGTRFYVAAIQRYLIAEDTGAPPGPPGTRTTLNVWIDGRGGTVPDTENCEDEVTGDGTAIAQLNPPAGLPVITGPIYTNHACHLPPS